MKLTQAILRTLMKYDPETGHFIWLSPTSRRVKAGDIVGSPHSGGYVQTKIFGKAYLLHRLAFLYMEGHLPVMVDHKDRIRTHNWWSNLRCADTETNARNRSVSARHQAVAEGTASGVVGVCPTPSGRWRAYLHLHEQQKYLGTFDTIDEAAEQRRMAAVEHYGEFAP